MNRIELRLKHLYSRPPPQFLIKHAVRIEYKVKFDKKRLNSASEQREAVKDNVGKVTVSSV